MYSDIPILFFFYPENLFFLFENSLNCVLLGSCILELPKWLSQQKA